MKKSIVKKIAISLIISVVVFFTIALGMILSQGPAEMTGTEGGLDFSGVTKGGPAPVRPGRDVAYGTDGRLGMQVYGPEGDSRPIVVMVHGSGWHGQQFDRLAAQVSAGAEVRVVTLRGHGAAPERRGDVDYLGQLEDDLATAITHDRRGRRVILLGHSSGGGLVIRFAGGRHGGLIDGAVLLAPFLQYDAPVTRENSGGWARPLTRRIVGLSMLNMVGVHGLDHLTAIQFAMPRAVLEGPLGHTATTAYSWRLNQSFAPRRDWGADVARLPPFVLIAGARDEAFRAEGYEAAMAPHTDKGRYEVIPGVGHLDVVNDRLVVARVLEMVQ